MKRMLVFLAGALLSAGCLPRTPGELSNGGFTYFCAGDDDLACRHDLFDASEIPVAIAVGAHFDIEFNPPFIDGEDNPTVSRIISAAPSVLAQELAQDFDADGFRFEKAGTVAVLAMAGNQVVDLIHLTGEPVDQVSLVDRLGDTPAHLTISLSGYGDTLEALPREESGVILAGALTYTWQSSDEGVVRVEPGAHPNEVELAPEGPGEATITVSVQGKLAGVSVTVEGKP